ncbi:putative exodeoxyribonuclease [Nitrincola phage 1M3-16]|uniref:exonuclease n=1 Tax=Nitrincola phage 1M3-16 TaxID=1472912 RepID=UPI000444C3C8|nr:exonuclease [Nitrincola phage 1M3-16]AHX01154.1 putative exodeoxyribonuclease [Nitrincola phage 1M3-16]
MTKDSLIYPTLKQPPPPEFAYIDGDSLIFMASASVGEQVWYSAKTPTGEKIQQFTSAKEYERWIWELKEGFSFDYKGDPDNLIREVEYEILPVNACYKEFDRLLKKYLKQSGVSDWKCYLSKASGLKNFRYDIATLSPYKGNRGDTRKPHHLEAVRRYALQNPKIITTRGSIETDDIVVANTEKMKHKAVLISQDKDSLQIMGSYVMILDQMTSPIFSSKKIVGRLENNGKKVVGTGALFLLFQMLKGDNVDGIIGLPKWGDAKAFKLLDKYSGACISHLPEAVQDVAEEYKKHYGDVHTYTHCYTGEETSKTWREVFEESLRLLWMLRNKHDKGELIMQYVPEELS